MPLGGNSLRYNAIVFSNHPKRSGNSHCFLSGRKRIIDTNTQLMATRTSAPSTDSIVLTGGHGRRLPKGTTFGSLSSIFEGGTV
jgi:hypothetical protein